MFLYGGNDYANTVVPYDTTSYAAYQAMRADHRLRRASSWRRPRSMPRVALPGGAPVRARAAAGAADAAVRRRQAGRAAQRRHAGAADHQGAVHREVVPLPPKLFSHNDQQSCWQASSPEGATSGWGGRIGDLFRRGNGNATFTCVTVAATRSSCRAAPPCSTRCQRQRLGARCSGAGSAAVRLDRLLDALRRRWSPRRARTCSRTSTPASRKRSIDADAQLDRGARRGAGAGHRRSRPATASRDQLKMVARMISARSRAGRQAPGVLRLARRLRHPRRAARPTHPGLLTQLGDALAAFHAATVELGVATRSPPSPPRTSAAR